ncbi:hypothetical protein M514_03865 [Trichuris suis]|uniref:ATP-dependent DNA helicase 2 subunit 1 n=1 Tax=Trichuris suis TaxID=68888 RepID=A0A085N7M6_9BILA|nr:hypothetical protein M513_03865 [Trichuris suis]KFD65472.1 hypothetical protein M514_03865 [Trichuris suis]
MDGDVWNFTLEPEMEEGDLQQAAWAGRDCILFLIDCSSSMVELKENGKRCFCNAQLCLEVVCKIYRQKCSSCSSDYVGIVLFNTEKMGNEHGFLSIYVLHQLGLPDAGKVKELERLTQKYSNIENAYGSGKASIEEVFWLCSMIFGGCRFRRRHSSMFLFTNCDEPQESDINVKKRGVQRIRDLKEKSVHIDLQPIGDNHFNYDKFYRAIFDDDEVPDDAPEATENSDELFNRVVVNYDRKWLSVATMPSAVKLDGRTNNMVNVATNFFDPMTGEKLYRFEVCKYQTYAGRRIAMTFQEVDQIAHFCRPGMVLLGFLPSSRLKVYHFVRHALFMQPDETVTKGSTVFFMALLTKCLERKMMAVCRLTARQNTSPRLVALLPQAETYDAMGVQVDSAGFHVIFLPYADDLRDLSSIGNIQRETADDDKLVQTMKRFVNSFRPPRSIGQIHNPALQKHRSVIEAFVLDREQVEPIDDETLPNKEHIDKTYGSVLSSFNQLMKVEDVSDKRKAKRKAESINDDEGSIDLRTEAKNGLLGRRTIAALRNACALNSVPLYAGQMRKAEIIEAIGNFYNV